MIVNAMAPAIVFIVGYIVGNYYYEGSTCINLENPQYHYTSDTNTSRCMQLKKSKEIFPLLI